MDEQRMKQILHIDTKALLDTLRDIETKLNDYNKQNAVPVWASSIIPRLEILESSISSFSRPSEGRDGGASVSSIVAEDRLLEKVKYEVDAKTNALRLAIDAKLASSSLELDRLLKLLQIRPTTSELQKVVLTVQDVDKKLQNVLGNISGTVISSVQQHVADEMQKIMNKLKETENIQSRSAEQSLRNIEHIAADLTAMKSGLQGDLDAVDKEIKRSHVNNDILTLDLNKLKERLNDYERKTNGTLEHLQKEHDATTTTIEDLSTTLFNRIKLIEDDIKTIQDTIASEAEKTQRAHDSLSNRIFDVVATVEMFQEEYKNQISAIRTDIESTNESLQNTIDRQAAIQEYIQQLQNNNVIPRLEEHDAAFAEVKADMESMESKMSEMTLVTIQLKNDNIDMKAEVDQLPTLLEAERTRIDQAHKDIKTVKDTVKRTNAMLKDSQSQIDDLKSVRDELGLIKDHSEHHESKLKDLGRKITKLLETTDDQDKRMEEAAQLIESTESKIEQVVNEVKAEFDDKLMLQNAEVEAKIAVLNETVSTMSTANTSKKNTRVAPPRMSEKKQTSIMEDDENLSPSASRPNTANADPDERRKSESNNVSGKIVELCLNFEEISAFRGATVLEIPGAICSQIAQLAQSAAALYAEMIDTEVIKRTLRGKADEVSYDESIDAKRQQLLDDAINDVRRQVQQRYGQPGMNRLEARDFFLRKYAQALQLAMSKFDQVMVPGQSRLGRIKIPTCIACDRPLLNKVRSDTSTRIESVSRGSYQPYHSSVLDQSTLTASQSTLLEVEATPEYSSPKRRNDATIRLPTTKKDSGKDKGAFIMRGGFKMPKQGGDEDRLKKIVLPDMFSMTS